MNLKNLVIHVDTKISTYISRVTYRPSGKLLKQSIFLFYFVNFVNFVNFVFFVDKKRFQG